MTSSPISRAGRPPFISRFMGREGTVCTQGEALGIEFNTSSPISVGKATISPISWVGGHYAKGLNPRFHLPFPRLGDHPSSPISWGRAVYTQGGTPIYFHSLGFLYIKGEIKIRGLIFSYTPPLSYTLLLHV